MPVSCRRHTSISCACWAGVPKNDRRLCRARNWWTLFALEGVNRSNAVVNFTEEDPIDPKALWLNSRAHFRDAGGRTGRQSCSRFSCLRDLADEENVRKVTPLIRERIRTSGEAVAVADFFFVDELPPYDPAELIPQKGDAAMARLVLEQACAALTVAEFNS